MPGCSPHALVLATALWAGCDTPDPQQLLGCRLGMSASQVREGFVRPGTWESRTDAAGLIHLTWSPDAPQDPVREANFELHEGLLVAVRLQLRDRDLVDGDDRIVLPELVRVVEADGEGTHALTLIARNCPVHAAEVERLLAE